MLPGLKYVGFPVNGAGAAVKEAYMHPLEGIVDHPEVIVSESPVTSVIEHNMSAGAVVFGPLISYAGQDFLTSTES
jgi:hypothetical protein